MASELGSPQLPTREGRESASANEKASTSAKMATLSDLRETKEALDAGLVSQADFDDVKRDYLRAQKEFLKRELEEKKEALVEFQKRELLAKEEFRKRELLAKEAYQQRKADAELRVFALESIIKHGASIMSEDQKSDLVREYLKMSGLDRLPADSAGALGAEPTLKRGDYKCSKCGQLKKGHICPFAKKPKGQAGTMTGEAQAGTSRRVQQRAENDDVPASKRQRVLAENRDAPPQGPLMRAPPAPTKKTSAFRGVYWRRDGWVAQVLRHGMYNYLGRYKEERAAARAYDMAKIKIGGAQATTNSSGGPLLSNLRDEVLHERAVTHMKEVFQKNPDPPMDERLRIAEMFALTKKQVVDWFASERYRMKAKESN